MRNHNHLLHIPYFWGFFFLCETDVTNTHTQTHTYISISIRTCAIQTEICYSSHLWAEVFGKCFLADWVNVVGSSADMCLYVTDMSPFLEIYDHIENYYNKFCINLFVVIFQIWPWPFEIVWLLVFLEQKWFLNLWDMAMFLVHNIAAAGKTNNSFHRKTIDPVIGG